MRTLSRIMYIICIIFSFIAFVGTLVLGIVYLVQQGTGGAVYDEMARNGVTAVHLFLLSGCYLLDMIICRIAMRRGHLILRIILLVFCVMSGNIFGILGSIFGIIADATHH